MEEKGIIIRKSDGETVSFDISKLIEAFTAAVKKTMETIAEIQEMATEAFLTALHELTHCICHFTHGRAYSRKRSLHFIIIYIWNSRYRKKPCITKGYDGISHIIRKVYLRHHQRISSNTDDSQIQLFCFV